MNLYVKPNINARADLSPASPVFQAVEKEFDAWIEGSNPANEYQEKYFGDESIYTKRGAIEQAIVEMHEQADDTGENVYIKDFDFDAIFSD